MPDSRVAGKRGRRSPSHEPSLRLSKFAPQPSPPPPQGDVSNGIGDWGMLGNDVHNDCGAAAVQHGRIAKSGRNVLTDLNGTELAADSQAATDYTLASYYAYGRAMGEPGPQPDHGVDNATWLRFLFDQGIIAGYAELNAKDPDEIHRAMLNFDGVLVGCDLTADADQEFASHQPWTITPSEQPIPNRGHDVYLVKYDDNAGTETVVTWGKEQLCAVAWEAGEVLAGDLEAWVFVTEEDAERNGVDLVALQEAIRNLGGIAHSPATKQSLSPVRVLTPVILAIAILIGIVVALNSSKTVAVAGLTFGSMLLSVLLVGACGMRTLEAEHITADGRMGQANWDFSQSFATNVTVIGSVLTAILGSSAFPSATNILPASAYAGLAVFFGVIVLLAPLFYNGTVIRVKVSPDQVDSADEYHGTVWGFLLAATVTTWGLAGSIATAFVALVELERNGSLSVAVVILLGVTLAAAVVFFGRYLWVRVDGTIVNEFDPAARAERLRRSTAFRAAGPYRLTAPTNASPPPSPKWTLL